MRQHAWGPGIHITYDDGNVRCHRCRKVYHDADDALLKRIERNKKGYTIQKCECGNTYGVAIDMIQGMVSFVLWNKQARKRKTRRQMLVFEGRHPDVMYAKGIHTATKGWFQRCM